MNQTIAKLDVAPSRNKSAESRDTGFSRAQKMGKDKNEPNMNLFP